MKKRGHYCKICGEYKANEKFSGKGHATHICKACASLPPEKKSEMMTINRLLSLPWRLSKEQVSWLKKKTHDKNPNIQALAEEQYEMRFAATQFDEDEADEDFMEDERFEIWGNRDYSGGAVWQYERIMEQSGFKLLRNEAVSIMLNSREQLFLAGLDDTLLGMPDIVPIMEEFQSEEYGFSILRTHEPDSADLYSDMGFDLIVSGHSHGGR